MTMFVSSSLNEQQKLLEKNKGETLYSAAETLHVKRIIKPIIRHSWDGREGEGGKYGESNMETYIAICKIDSQ